MSSIPTLGPDESFGLSNWDVRGIINDEGSGTDTVAAGSVVAFKTASVDSATVLPDKFVLPNAGGDEIDSNAVGIMGVLLEDTVFGSKGTIRIRGVVDVLTGDTSAIGSGLQAHTDGELIEASTVEKVVAFNLETAADGVRKKCIFDGFNGFGVGI